MRVLGYYTGTQGSYDAVGASHASINMVSADIYDVTSSGTITGSDDLKIVAKDTGYGIDTFACISNFSSALNDFDPALAHSAMVTNKDAVVAAAVNVAKGGGYRGVNIDFESLAFSANVADDRAAYTSFIHAISTALHAAGLELVISVPGKTADDSTNTWSYPYDFAALGPDVDYVQLMTYDEHGPGWSGPGAVSGADWVAQCVVYGVSVLPAPKILIGLPAYGYDWDLTASAPPKYVGKSVPWTDSAALLATPGAATHFDTASSTPYVDYTSSDGHKHELWYENAASLQAKTTLVRQHHLGGLSTWAMGDENAAFWQAVYAAL